MIKVSKSGNTTEINFDQLTVFIGNNDSGKSSLIDILEIALDRSKKPDDKDFYTCSNGNNAERIEVKLVFILDTKDEKAKIYSINSILTYRVVYTKEDSKAEFLTLIPKEEELQCDFKKLSAQEQKDIIEKFNPELLQSLTNSDLRTNWFDEFIKTAEKVENWKEIDRTFHNILPLIHRYSAMDYKSPENIINQTIKTVFESILFEQNIDENNQERTLKGSLLDIEKEAETKINEKIEDLTKHIKKYAPSIIDISFEPHIDFTRGFQSGVFRVNEGQGNHYLDKSGDGTKRKVFMATTDWDREVTLSIQAESEDLPLIIRAYDEPDTNLDYQAQLQLYKSISAITIGENSNVQSIISTHSPRMIDRAPAKSIRMLRTIDGIVEIEKLVTEDDQLIEGFLTDISRDLGITNMLMFYERCFIFVEGETEEIALPLFYKTLYGTSLLEDGINIINVKGKSAFKEFLRLFSKNKQQLSLFLMDKDCEETNDDKLTKQVLKENGYSDEFLNERVVLVGQQEFEDIFSLEVYLSIYNREWPKLEGQWSQQDFDGIDKNKNYSDELKRLYFTEFGTSKGWSKPQLGIGLGRHCTDNDIPQVIKDLYSFAREISLGFS